jgi:hypothetical protein
MRSAAFGPYTTLEGNRSMITHSQESTGENLLELLAACNETGAAAERLANQARRESLRALLYERAHRYRRSAEEIIECLQTLPQVPAERPRPTLIESGADVASIWEAAECEALMHFRDALDTELPVDAESAVLRHIEDGVRALERLRELNRPE